MIVRAVIAWDEESQAYSATCPELNFVSSFGDTKDEAMTHLKDAIQLMLEPLPRVTLLEAETEVANQPAASFENESWLKDLGGSEPQAEAIPRRRYDT